MTQIEDKEIENYVNGLTEFQKNIVLSIREVILSADSRIQESIKWGSIAFHHKKNICGFRVAKAHITLLFMEGASLAVPNILKGDGAKARTYKVTDAKEIDSTALNAFIRESLELGM